MDIEPVLNICVSGVMTRSAKAPSATAGFTIEPGGYKPPTARFKKGFFWSFTRAATASGEFLSPLTKMFGSNSGTLTIATISPFVTSITIPTPPANP